MSLQQHLEQFAQAERAYERALERHGLPFEADESSPRERRAAFAAVPGCRCENGGASIWRNWISPACLACRTGQQTGSLFVDLRCTKHCYFCFNANQPHFQHFLAHKRDIVLELEQAHAAGARYRCLAVTGGEPLLNKDAVTAFFRRAGQLYPQAHTRLYTNGELLDDATLAELAESGLREIRFSVKPADVDASRERVLETMEKAVEALPDVVIELPVIPESLDEMKRLMRRADQLGVRGMNLLELCFPLHNAEEFAKRRLKLRKHPFLYPYDYWYGGGIPVAESEREALDLVAFAAEEDLRLGVHYCSADNRNSAQVWLQNRPFSQEAAIRDHYPWLAQDEGDHFLKCAKAFGSDAPRVRAWAEHRGFPCSFNEAEGTAAFPLRCVGNVREDFPRAELAESAYILETNDDTVALREVGLRALNG